ncbi:MAG TPA: hypothetical protein VHN99_01080 [Deinococcales bacterium]|nr:hypothetical protein [Deinococcales bacterium]
MKSLLIAALATLSFTPALAADLNKIADTQETFLGAVNGTLGDTLGSVQYIPGYGLNLQARAFGTPPALAKVKASITKTITALGDTVQGLDPNDWLSITYKCDTYQLVVRAHRNNVKAVEAWVNGKKQ